MNNDEVKGKKTKTKSKSAVEVVEKSAKKPTRTKKTSQITVVNKKKILYVASESAPFIATGGLAEVIGSLPKALAIDPAYDVRVVLPLYSGIKAEWRRKFAFLGNIYVPLGWRNQYCGIFSYEYEGVTFYFIDNEYYFKRNGCYGYYDDGERFAFFSRSALEIMPFIGFYPDVLHCHDWQAALSAIYLKTLYKDKNEYQNIRALFTIHNIEYQGKYSLDILGDLFGLPEETKGLVEYDGCINLMKGAIECSERFSTVSPTYAQEIKSERFAHGLQEIIRRNDFKLTGILNGIDVVSYDSQTDKALVANYSVNDLSNKVICKAEMQKMLQLPVRADVPVISMITRLVSHKGLELVKSVIESILAEDVQFVLLGTGDTAYEEFFKDLAKRYEGKTSVNIAFNGALSRQIYAGSDIFLMPSISEPCGLSQMICSRYATVPVVRETGGLYDSIKPFGAGGNGFTFASTNPYDMLYVIHEALDTYKNKEVWTNLMKKVATTDFSWLKSAEEYKKLYETTTAY
ncbi:MAG: glycogen synthase GlgA [Clostridiales bacterium]|nr:glycogen synthase GlgA [Clostridiales bacterium]